MVLAPLEIVNGVFSLIGVLLGFYAGVRIALKYRELHKKEFLIVGMVGILVTEPWWPHSVSLIYALATGSDSGLDPVLYFLIGNLLIPVGILMWLWAFSELTYKDKQKLILIIGFTYLIVFEFVFFYLLFTNISLIGVLRGAVDVRYNYGLLGLLLPGLLIVLITGLLFAFESMKSDKPEIKLRGKLIGLAFISYTIAGIIDGFAPHNIITIPLAKMGLLISAMLFYSGFMMPNWVKKRFFIEN